MKRILSAILILITLLSCVTLTVSADEGVITDEGRLPFEDVKDSHWFYEAVKFCYANEIIKGMNEYTFGWNGNLTRAQFVQMLATIDGADLTQYQVSVFDDVKPNHWYYAAIAWAYETKLTSGVSATKFGANDPVTRSQMARFMMTYMAEKYSVEIKEDCLDEFNDADKIRDWAVEGIKYAVSAGLISGMEMNGKLCVNPDGTTTRAQAAVIFRNFILNYYYGECEHEFTDAACTESAVCGKCGLTDGLPTGHTLTAYDCVTGGKCSVCEAEVEPSKLIHDFAPATCTAPMTCTRCQATRGEANGHSWWAATCVNPKMCKICYATEGNKSAHNYSGGKCTRCGELSPYNKIVNDLKNAAGTYVPEANSYAYVNQIYCGVASLIYSVDNDTLTLSFTGIYDDGSYDTTVILLPKNGYAKDFGYACYDASGQCVFIGEGTIDPATVNSSTIPNFTSYEGDYNDLNAARENAGFELDLALLNGMSMINHITGVSLSDFGFINYP